MQEERIRDAIIRTTRKTFPYVRVYKAYRRGGVHILASKAPLKQPTREEWLERLPEKAKDDLLEWKARGRGMTTLTEIYRNVIKRREIKEEQKPYNENDAMITDDQPYNEYFLLRRLFGRGK